MNLDEADRMLTRNHPAIRVGCAGWVLSSKVASLFPGEGSHLERYARMFSCVEINSSFYRSHQPKTYARWAESVPDAFRFSVKVPRTITHQLRLKECEAPLRAFLEEVAPLKNKLGCLLVQLPPSLALNPEDALGFFSLVRDCTPVQVACEPRHASWFTPTASSIFNEAGIVCVRAHPIPTSNIDMVPESAAMLYIRLHGAPDIYYSAYDDTFIEAVAARIRLAHQGNKQVWCIFDNTARGNAAPNALTLIKRLEHGS